MSDTIFALSSGAGAAGIAVFRLSGENTKIILAALLHNEMPAPRYAALRALRDPQKNEVIDHALVLWLPGPHSYTGDDMAELHIHGSRAVKDYLTRLLPQLAPCRLAMPGEFTRRAFEAGKLDLTRAEGINDLIMAETEAQRAQAVRQIGGALDVLYEGWKDRLVKSLAYVEATLDFVDEDLPDDVFAKLEQPVRQVAQEIENHLQDNRRGERLRDGFRIAIIGAPNAGKSTLLNALAQRDVAIVSDIAGTTRDVLEVHLDLGGYPVILSDTAGLRMSDDVIEAMGIDRARSTAAQADLKIALFDAMQEPDAETQNLIDDATIIVWNKSDLGSQAQSKPNDIHISASTGQNLNLLLDIIKQKIAMLFDKTSEAPSLTRARHRESLIECLACLQRSESAPSLELRAEDWRLAVRALGKITGRIDVEDLLDIIFKDFCIGK